MTSKHLLLDPRKVASLERAQLVIGQVEKYPHNPLFIEDQPWEVRYDNLYPNVVYDATEGVFKCWYNVFIIDEVYGIVAPAERGTLPYRPQKREMGLCYAVSQDGVHWDKPNLGLIEFNGSTANNIVLRHIHGAGVYQDIDATDPNQRFKAFMREGIATSPDGLHWSAVTACPEIQARGDTHNYAFWGPDAQTYVGITRLWDGKQRIVGRTVSPDYRQWTQSVEVMRGLPDEPHRQTYALLPFRYADGYLALVMIFDIETDLVDCELAWSADTIQWDRVCPGQPFIPRGPEGSFDWGCIYGGATPILHDGHLHLYYGGSDDTHLSWRRASLGLARLRPDTFAGIEPLDDATVGRVVTQPVVCDGSHLAVSADAAGGTLRVGILDVEGRSLADCDPLTANVTDGLITWRGSSELSQLHGQAVQLVFELRQARVYAWGFSS